MNSNKGHLDDFSLKALLDSIKNWLFFLKAKTKDIVKLSFLFLNFYPKAEPGCEVIVPKKPTKNPLAASQILNFTTGLAALLLAINQIK